MNGLQSTPDQGVVIAVDDSYELYLPWWWEHYSTHCTLHVTIIDLGMTESARLYSLSKGNVVPFSPDTSFITPKEGIAPELTELWEKRPLWFAKPFYLQKSPYKKTLYMDIDCKVQSPITPLLDTLPIDAFSLVKHPLPHPSSSSAMISHYLGPYGKRKINLY